MLSSAAFLLLAILMSGRFTADAGTSAPASGAPTTIVVVQPGESLWEIATRSQPNADPREVVTTIRALNALGDATIVAGQSILVPGSARSSS